MGSVKDLNDNSHWNERKTPKADQCRDFPVGRDNTYLTASEISGVIDRNKVTYERDDSTSLRKQMNGYEK